MMYTGKTVGCFESFAVLFISRINTYDKMINISPPTSLFTRLVLSIPVIMSLNTSSNPQ